MCVCMSNAKVERVQHKNVIKKNNLFLYLMLFILFVFVDGGFEE